MAHFAGSAADLYGGSAAGSAKGSRAGSVIGGTTGPGIDLGDSPFGDEDSEYRSDDGNALFTQDVAVGIWH